MNKTELSHDQVTGRGATPFFRLHRIGVNSIAQLVDSHLRNKSLHLKVEVQLRQTKKITRLDWRVSCSLPHNPKRAVENPISDIQQPHFLDSMLQQPHFHWGIVRDCLL